jgi:hypothetical protein
VIFQGEFDALRNAKKKETTTPQPRCVQMFSVATFDMCNKHQAQTSSTVMQAESSDQNDLHDDGDDHQYDPPEQQLQLQAIDSSASAESIRVPLAIFLRLQAQRAELLTAARGVAPMLTSMRAQLCQWMQANAVHILDYPRPLYGQVRCVERKVQRRASVDDVLALVALDYGEAARERLEQKLKALVEQSVETRRDVRITFKRGAEFARERHQAVIEGFVPRARD